LKNDAKRLAIPIHAFDLIVADECGYRLSGCDLAPHARPFDAVKVGLTATPSAYARFCFKDSVCR
jgi:type I restriction enzyme R subunit